MNDLVCPQCRTTKYRNPSLKLLVNVCGHSLCEGCVDLLFLKCSGSCPECGVVLKKNHFRTQIFEDPTVEKEVDIRKRILKDYNKTEEDFPSLNEYNDYLEEIERLIFNLVNGIDTLETNQQIEQYKRDNKDAILKNKMKLARTEIELNELLELEKESFESRKADIVKNEVENKVKKMMAKEAMIDELMFSESNAKSIVKTFKDRVVEEIKEEAKDIPLRQSHFSTGVKFGRTFDYGPVKIEEAPLFTYSEPIVYFEGPSPPSKNVDLTQYLPHIRSETVVQRAGGYNPSVSVKRALQDAVSGLYFSLKV